MIAVANDLLAEGKDVSVTTLCRVLELPRSTAYYKPKTETHSRPCDPELAGMIRAIIEDHPAFAYAVSGPGFASNCRPRLTAKRSTGSCVFTGGRCASGVQEDAPASKHFPR